MMPEFQIACPQNLADVLTEASRLQGEVLFVNGGTDLILELKSGQKRADWLIDLSQVTELHQIKETQLADEKAFQGKEAVLKLGSGVTFTQLGADPLVGKYARCLAQAGRQMGSTQIRNRATLGGNIASASPAGDSLPALAALEAELTVIGPGGERALPAAELLAARENKLQPRELITEIRILLPAPGVERRSAFAKIGSRTQVSIARLNLAAVMELENGVMRKLRLAVGAIGKAPLRLYQFEQEWEGKTVAGGLTDKVNGEQAGENGEMAGKMALALAENLTATVDQAIPGRHSQAYKRQAVRALAYDAMDGLFSKQPLTKGGGSHDRS